MSMYFSANTLVVASFLQETTYNFYSNISLMSKIVDFFNFWWHKQLANTSMQQHSRSNLTPLPSTGYDGTGHLTH